MEDKKVEVAQDEDDLKVKYPAAELRGI